MIRKLFIVALLIVISQATVSVQAAMHFPGTAKVHNSVFQGSGRVEGFGNFITSSKVSLHLTGNLQAICEADSDPGEDPTPQGINFSEDAPALTRNGQASFTFPDVSLLQFVGLCYDSHTPLGVRGTLNVQFIANEFKNPSTLFATAVLPFTCNIDESGPGDHNTNCPAGQETTSK